MNKPLTVMIIDNETWYSENDWRILVAQKLELEERLKAATDDAKEAEAYVEELEADNKGLRHMILDQINSTGDDPEIMAATRAEWAARAKAAEAKLAKAIETLQVFADDANWFDSFELDAVTINPTWRGPTFTPEQFARDVIEELKGGSDEQTTDSHDY